MKRIGGCLALAMVAALFGVSLTGAQAPRAARPAAQGFITGVVRSAQGPEAGVWVIAETKDLATNFIKIVVTDDRGRFMLPELPGATYSVWVRGYGLVDSKPIAMKPAAAAITLDVTPAATPQDAGRPHTGCP
jgi:hypothetical protein